MGVDAGLATGPLVAIGAAAIGALASGRAGAAARGVGWR